MLTLKLVNFKIMFALELCRSKISVEMELSSEIAELSCKRLKLSSIRKQKPINLRNAEKHATIINHLKQKLVFFSIKIISMLTESTAIFIRVMR